MLLRSAIVMALLMLSSGNSWAQTFKESVDDDVILPLMNNTLERERAGTEVRWANPSTGNTGTILVLATLTGEPDKPCRSYRRTRQRPEAPVETQEGVGCRVGPGEWELDESESAKAGEAVKPKEVAKTTNAPPLRCPPIDSDFVLHVPCARATPFVAFSMPAKADY